MTVENQPAIKPAGLPERVWRTWRAKPMSLLERVNARHSRELSMAGNNAHHLFNHLQNVEFRDERCGIVFACDDRSRLRPTYLMEPGDWRDVSQIIYASAKFRTAWLPDTNVAILDETTAAWDALRFAALGSSTGSTVITGVVRQVWLENPRRHEDRAKAIHAALADETWARSFGLEDNSPILPAIFGYVRLLGLRRYLALPTLDGLTMVGTNPEKKSDTMNAIGNKVGRRAQSLARKGRIDAKEDGEVKINDELLCLMAICYSLLTARESVILTADKDFTEVFWKAQWFFHTHYRAYLAAKLVRAGEFGKPAKVLESSRGYFDGPLTLYRRHTSHLAEVLPRIYRSIPVSVIYVAPDNMIHKIGSRFEREMLDMLEMRSKTCGRCTDLFGVDNIHVDLGPLKVGLDGLYLGIGRDAGDWVETNDTKTFMSRLDAEHALSCKERVAP